MDLSSSDFDDVRKAIHDLCGLAIGDEKQYLVKSRLQPVLEQQGLNSYAALIQRLRQSESLLLKDQIIEAITTNETSFNRDTHPFEALRHRILLELTERMLARRKAGLFSGQQARIWCAAVATGQEAYSVAMAVDDYVRARATGGVTASQFPILASDISGQALAQAQVGRYSSAEVERGVTTQQRARYFRQEQGGWVVEDALRQSIEFRRLNLISAKAEPETCDLILCRNVLIYFDQATRVRLATMLHGALRPNGILLLGSAESLFGVCDVFASETIGRTTVYRKAVRKS